MIRIIINSYNNWFDVIGYVNNTNIYSHIYPITYNTRVQMLLHKNVVLLGGPLKITLEPILSFIENIR